MNTAHALSEGRNRAQLALHKTGLPATIRRVWASTRTAEDSATVIGCGVGQIVNRWRFAAAIAAELT